MTLKYMTTTDLKGRTAIELTQKLSTVPSQLWIDFDNRHINPKSLIGLLSATIKNGDIIQILYYDNNITNSIKSIFSDIAVAV